MYDLMTLTSLFILLMLTNASMSKKYPVKQCSNFIIRRKHKNLKDNNNNSASSHLCPSSSVFHIYFY